ALRLDVKVQQPQALGGEFVNSRGWRAAQYAASIATKLAPPEVIPKEKYDVRFCLTHFAMTTNPRIEIVTALFSVPDNFQPWKFDRSLCLTKHNFMPIYIFIPRLYVYASISCNRVMIDN